MCISDIPKCVFKLIPKSWEKAMVHATNTVGKIVHDFGDIITAMANYVDGMFKSFECAGDSKIPFFEKSNEIPFFKIGKKSVCFLPKIDKEALAAEGKKLEDKIMDTQLFSAMRGSSKGQSLLEMDEAERLTGRELIGSGCGEDFTGTMILSVTFDGYTHPIGAYLGFELYLGCNAHNYFEAGIRLAAGGSLSVIPGEPRVGIKVGLGWEEEAIKPGLMFEWETESMVFKDLGLLSPGLVTSRWGAQHALVSPF